LLYNYQKVSSKIKKKTLYHASIDEGKYFCGGQKIQEQKRSKTFNHSFLNQGFEDELAPRMSVRFTLVQE
jgi:hypothetical protein